jgi:tetratricopeptide (TPR) repeat protein
MAYQSEIEKLEQRFREKPEQWFAALADAYRKNGDLDLAIELLNTWIEQRPTYTSGHIVLGRCFLDKQKDTEAAATFQNVLNLDPENIIALKSLSDIAARAGDMDGARRWLERLLEVDPMNEDAEAALAKLGGPRAVAPPVAEAQAVESFADLGEPEAVSGFEPTAMEEHPAVEEPAPVEMAPEEPVASAPAWEPPAAPEPMGMAEPGEEPAETPEPMRAGESQIEPEPEAAEEAFEPIAGGWQGVEETVSELPAVEVGEESVVGDLPDPGATLPLESASPPPEPALERTIAEFDIEPAPPVSEFEEEPAAPAERDIGVERDIEVEHYEPTLTSDLGARRGGPDLLGMEIERSTGALKPQDVGDLEEAAVEGAASIEWVEPAGGEETVAELPAVAPPEPESAPLELIMPSDVAPEEAIGAAQEPEPVVTQTMAELYARQGLVAEARDIYQRLLEDDPGNNDLRTRLANLSRQPAPSGRGEPRGRYSVAMTGGRSAMELLQSIARAVPGSPNAPAEPAAPGAPGAAALGAAGSAGAFDAFYGAQPEPPESSPPPAEPAGGPEDTGFQDWLRGLKT